MESIFIFLLFFILGPIIKGLIESDKTRKQWEQKQRERQMPPKVWPKVHNTGPQGRRKRQFHDINAERPKPSPIFMEFQDKDYSDETADFVNPIDEKDEDTKKTTQNAQPDISKSFLQQPSEQIRPSSEHESLSFEDIFSGNNLMYAIALKEILDPPKARR